MTSTTTKLIDLYARMAEHTRPECGAACSRPFGCCNEGQCEVTIAHAKEEWGVTLAPTGHATLPLMGKDGCAAAPHLRPLCTIHTCAISFMDLKPGDPEWTATYHQLRDQISDLEFERMFPQAEEAV